MSTSAYRAGAQSGVGAWTHGHEVGQIKEIPAFPSMYAPGEIVVNFGDRRLYYVEARGRALSYPIAIPREQDRWEGVTVVSDKKVKPSWIPTADMMRENPRLPSYVPGGHPMNPLGVRALYLGTTTYRIHGTDAPWIR
jgi:lipoprotein-anchoring transpeptidase ErfK/SrfK